MDFEPITNEQISKICDLINLSSECNASVQFDIKVVGTLMARIAKDMELHAKVEALEALRPHWAQGHSSDSAAAQAATVALAGLWQLLCTDNQTEAVERLKGLIDRVRASHNSDKSG